MVVVVAAAAAAAAAAAEAVMVVVPLQPYRTAPCQRVYTHSPP
jgi:hypothetical protein